MIMLLAASLGAAKAYLDHQLRLEFNSSLQSVADIFTLKYSEINTSLLGSIYLTNLHLTTKDNFVLHIDTVTLYKAYQFYFSNPLPQHVSIAIKNLQIPQSDTTSSVPVLMSILGYSSYYLSPRELRDLGLYNIKANVYLEAKSTQQKTILLVTINARSWGKLTLLADLTNPFPSTLLPSISQIQLTSFKLTYTDHGLVKRIFTKLAQRNKITLPNFKQTLLAKLKTDLNQIDFGKDIFNSLQQFIQTPIGLTVHLQPSQPIAINTLANASPKQLGLKIIALHQAK